MILTILFLPYMILLYFNYLYLFYPRLSIRPSDGFIQSLYQSIIRPFLYRDFRLYLTNTASPLYYKWLHLSVFWKKLFCINIAEDKHSNMEAILIRLTRISRISNNFQTLQLLVLQHPLPASFRQQEGGALMVLNQSKKNEIIFFQSRPVPSSRRGFLTPSLLAFSLPSLSCPLRSG